jgi:tRNA threonylcarbamoyl adenosine modification protein YeaZ
LSGLNSFKFTPKDLLIDNNSSINTDIMNFLSIDCSTDIGSLFVKTKNKTFSKILQSDKSNNDLLMKKILDFFKENNLKFGDISKIYVNQGPGNFSGLRGSLAIAKGVSLSKNLNLFGYNTFIWSCAKFFNKKDFIFSLIKFRKKYFIKKFHKNLLDASKIKEVTEEEIIKKYDNKFKVIPKNAAKYFDKKILELNNLSIENLDHNELEFLKLKGLLNKDLIRPLYLS